MQPQMNGYDFLNTPDAPKKVFFLPKGAKGRLLIAIGSVFVVILLFTIIGLLKGGGDKTSTTLVRITQQQNEIVRIAKLAATTSSGGKTQNTAVTIYMAVQTDQAKVIERLKSAGKAPSEQTLAATKDSSIDTKLSAADNSGTFDEVFTQTLRQAIAAYQQTVKQAYDQTGNQATKQVLSDSYAHTSTLLEAL